MMDAESSSTIRDFPVPDELIMEVDLEYGSLFNDRKSEIVFKRAFAALPSYLRFHPCTAAAAIIRDGQGTIKKDFILSRTIYSG
jgi:hypothetical protein